MTVHCINMALLLTLLPRFSSYDSPGTYWVVPRADLVALEKRFKDVLTDLWTLLKLIARKYSVKNNINPYPANVDKMVDSCKC